MSSSDDDIGPPRPSPEEEEADVGPPRPPVDDDDDDAEVGPPRPAAADEAPRVRKKRKVLDFEDMYLTQLPMGEMYEKSYMHRDTVTHVLVSCTDFVITASKDGQVKFWKKVPGGIEFVKHFRAHLGPITGISVSADGAYLATVSVDRSLKMYDVQNFDMISMVKLDFLPSVCEWVHSKGAPDGRVAVADAESSAIRVYRARSGKPDADVVNRSVHGRPVTLMRYNHVHDTVVSMDSGGMVEYWRPSDFEFPTGTVSFSFKAETHLYEFAKKRTVPMSLEISKDGAQFVCVAADKQVRVFNFLTGKMRRVFNENVEEANRLQRAAEGEGAEMYKLDSIDFGRRMAVEKSISHEEQPSNAIFDDSGNFLIYATMLGVKLVNLVSNTVVRLLGKVESNERFLSVALYQGTPKVKVGTQTALATAEADPTLICTSHGKNRFFYFTKREPEEEGRDVFNEKPSKDDLAVVIEAESAGRDKVRGAILRTNMGDIHIKLFPDECPKTVENFTTHSKNGYYDNLLFHRIIKSFMLQTGDPKGNGTGGTSIWGGEFEDEFDRNLRHDRPYTVSMANAGPGTNGSQFFITTVPAPWLDNKHTVFGRVTKGGDVCQEIEGVKTDRNDKPYKDVKIINIDIV